MRSMRFGGTPVPVEAPPVFEEGIELEYPIVLLEPLAFLLARLLNQSRDYILSKTGLR